MCSVGVGLHVAVEIPRLRKSKIADLAPVRLLSTVNALVFGESGRVREALAAVVTSVGPLSRVCAKVSCDG